MKFKLGVFDSGIGGMTLMAECLKLMPKVHYYYLGDNTNAPYGNLSKQKILSLTKKAFENFVKLDVDAVVVACNTVTAECVDILRKDYKFKIFGVEPAVKPALKYYDGRKILTISTVATQKSIKFKKLIKKLGRFKFQLKPIKNLAIDIEKNIMNLQDLKLDNYFTVKNNCAIVLGCTHYIYLKEHIEKTCNLPVIDGNFGTAKNIQKFFYPKLTSKTIDNGNKINQLNQNNPIDNEDIDNKFLSNDIKINDIKPSEIDCFNNTKNKKNNINNIKKPQITFLGDSKDYNHGIFDHLFGNQFKQN